MENWGKVLESEFTWIHASFHRSPENLPFFFDCRNVLLTLRRDEDGAVDPQLSFTNVAGETVFSCPYKGDQSLSEVVPIVSLKVGVNASRICLILPEGNFVQPDGATIIDDLFSGAASSSAAAPLVSEDFIMEKAKAVMTKIAASGWPSESRENIPPFQVESKDEFPSIMKWSKLQELGLPSRLNSILDLPEDFPCDIVQKWSTSYFCYAGGLYRTKFFAFLLSNSVLLLLLEQEYGDW